MVQFVGTWTRTLSNLVRSPQAQLESFLWLMSACSSLYLPLTAPGYDVVDVNDIEERIQLIIQLYFCR